jgi:hypothetical protein
MIAPSLWVPELVRAIAKRMGCSWAVLLDRLYRPHIYERRPRTP